MLLDGLATEPDETVEAIGDIDVGVGARAHLALAADLFEAEVIQLTLEARVLGVAVVLAEDLGLEADRIVDQDATGIPLDEAMAGRFPEHSGEVVEELRDRSWGLRQAHHSSHMHARLVGGKSKKVARRRRQRCGRVHTGHCGGGPEATGWQGHQRLHLAWGKEGNLAAHGCLYCAGDIKDDANRRDGDTKCHHLTLAATFELLRCSLFCFCEAEEHR